MRFIGDVHGKIEEYKELVEVESLQVGDMGFDYSDLDVSRDHRFVCGNHDNYHNLPPQALIGYGMWREIFYISGGYSVDKTHRREGRDWFAEEELSVLSLNNAIDYCLRTKPQTIVTHSAPSSIVEMMFDKVIQSRTKDALQSLFELFQPKLWVFGHFHTSWQEEVNGTKFICLDELEVYND